MLSCLDPAYPEVSAATLLSVAANTPQASGEIYRRASFAPLAVVDHDGAPCFPCFVFTLPWPRLIPLNTGIWLCVVLPDE
jgi:hypothetical protein